MKFMRKVMACLLAFAMIMGIITASDIGLQEVEAYSTDPVNYGGEGGETPRIPYDIKEDGTVNLFIGGYLTAFFGGDKAIENPGKVAWYATEVEYDFTHYTEFDWGSRYCIQDFFKKTSESKLIASGKTEITLNPKDYTGLVCICVYYDGKCFGDQIIGPDYYMNSLEPQFSVEAVQDLYVFKNNTVNNVKMAVTSFAKDGTKLTYQWFDTNKSIAYYQYKIIDGATSDTYTLKGLTGADDNLTYACVISDGIKYTTVYFWVKFDNHNVQIGDVPSDVVATESGANVTFDLSGDNIDVKIFKDYGSWDESISDYSYVWDDDIDIAYDSEKGKCTITFPNTEKQYSVCLIDKTTQKYLKYCFYINVHEKENLLYLNTDNSFTLNDMEGSSDSDSNYSYYKKKIAYTAKKDGIYSFVVDNIKNTQFYLEYDCDGINAVVYPRSLWTYTQADGSLVYNKYLKAGETFAANLSVSSSYVNKTATYKKVDGTSKVHIAVTYYGDNSKCAALGHTWDDGVITKKATASATGVKTYACEVCGATKTEAIPMLQASKVILKNKSVAYTGKTVSVGKATVTGSTGKVTYTYYTDSKCSKKTTSAQGASKKGAAPKNAGTYYVRAKVAADDTYAEATSNIVKLTISKAATTITLKKKNTGYTGKTISIGKATVKGSTGKITYTYYTDSKCTKKTTSAQGASKKGAAPSKRGTYYVKAKVAADSNYKAATSSVVKFTITKGTPTIKIASASKTVKKSDVKKKAQTLSIGATVTGNGKLTYAKSSGSDKLTINKNSGEVTIKKGTAAGTYKIKVKISAKASPNYNAGSRTVTLTVTVK